MRRPAPSRSTAADVGALTHPKYRRDIDGLRGIAVLSVVAFHAFPNVVKGGFIGVDIFFVISGFLISTIIFGSLERNSFSFVEFYARRIRRILPALITVLAASFAVGWLVLLADEFEALGKHIAGGAAFLSNVVLVSESGYFDVAAETKPLLHLWSLGIEEQFYVFYPLLLWLAWRWRVNLLAAVAAVALLSFLLNVSQSATNGVVAFYYPHTRMWELMAGSILAYRTPRQEPVSAIWQNVQSALGAALLGIGVLVITREKAFPGWWALFPTLGAALLISGGARASMNRWVLSHRVLVWIGLVSYPLYLWHWTLLVFLRIVHGDVPPRGMRLGAVALSVALSWLTYRLVERPIRDSKRGRATVICLAALLAMVGYAGYEADARGGLRFRSAANPPVMNEGDLGHDELYKYQSEHFFLCTPLDIRRNALTYKEWVRCFQSKDRVPIDTAIVGDSHAEHLFIGLAESLPQHNVAYYVRDGQPAINRIEFKRIFDYIISSGSIRTVVITAFWLDRGVPVEDLAATVKTLADAGKQILLTDDVPGFIYPAASCKYRRRFRQADYCVVDASGVDRKRAAYYPALQSVANGQRALTLVNTTRYFCDSSQCAMNKDGVLLYRDPNHLNINGSKYVGKLMVRDYPQLVN